MAAPPPKVSVPALTVVFPEYVFAPLNVNSPTPAFVRPNAPLNAPLKTTGLATVSVVAALNVPAPLQVKAPFFVVSPKVTVPFSV
jgi:hypothetical protein